MGGARRGTDKLFSLHESAVTSTGLPITLTDIDVGRPHCFAGVQFFSDAAGTVEATPTAGSLSITIQTLNTLPKFESPPDPNIIAASPTTVNWSANTKVVTITPTGIVGALFYKLVVTCNEK